MYNNCVILLRFSELTATHRVIIGLPGDSKGEDGPRMKYRRGEIEKIVAAHIDEMLKSSSSLEIDSLEYAVVRSTDPVFRELFPLHTETGARNAKVDMLKTPAVKLVNTATKKSMSPDWDILLDDFPGELLRLVNDFERWQTQTTKSIIDSDGVHVVHATNQATVAANHDGAPVRGGRNLVVMFYAPWCVYSKAMIPRFAEAASIIKTLETRELLAPGSIGFGKVNEPNLFKIHLFDDISSR
jgi:thiol-disulfide isomerase/thioredoxin